MAEKTTYKRGTKVQGSGHFKNLRGVVIASKSTSFGFNYSLVDPGDGSEKTWARNSYLEPVLQRSAASEDWSLDETGFHGN